MYLSRPKITPDHVDKQLLKQDTNSQSQKETTVMVRDDSVRHPVTARWTRQYQNKQSPAGDSMDEDSTEKGMFTDGKRKGP